MSQPEGEQPRRRDALATLRIPRRDESPRRSPWARLLRWTLVLAVLAAIGCGGLLVAQRSGWLQSLGELVPQAIRSLPEVRVTKVVVERGRSADALVVATGYLESRRQAKIGARAAGRIEVIHVEEGSRVKTGQELAVLEHKDIDAALAATEATLLRAKAELLEQDVQIARDKSAFDRAKRLRATRSTTEAEYETARYDYDGAVARRESLQAAVQLAAARVDEAKQLQENMIIRAPFDGTVISKDAEVGESILPGGMGEASGRGSVVSIADLDHLEVDSDVKEDYISRVIADAPTEVAVDAVPDRRYQGRVRKIIPMGDPARATIKVKVEILDADERLFPDMSATVYFLPSSQPQAADADQRRMFCDSGAIQRDQDGSFVWLLDDQNRAAKAPVVVGADRDEQTEIKSGLNGGQRVILQPPSDIQDGKLFKIRE